MPYSTALCGIAVMMFGVVGSVAALAAELDDAITTVRTTSPTSGATDEIRAAWRELAAAEASALPEILRSMKDANPAAENWLRAAADALAERVLASGGELSERELQVLLADTDASPRGRRVAYEWLARIQPQLAERLLASMTNDASLEIRYDAVALGLENLKKGADKKVSLRSLIRMLRDARDLDQLKNIKLQLEELGQQVDLASHMGFITTWRIIGPFDNTDESGFSVVYPPEKEIDLTAKYDGKTEQVSWLGEPVTTDDELGVVDINEALGPVKGAAAYALATFDTDKAQPAVIRYASLNATKLWVNGRLVASHEVYHAGGGVDQYVEPINLRAGENTILLKVCQNEQTEPWAQVWEFQLRVSDEMAGAIRPAN